MFSDAKEDLQLLKDAVVHYQQKTNQESTSIIKANEKPNPWEDVREAVKVAKDREDGQDKDSWSAKNSCNKIVDNISTFETWLDLLPGGDYGAIVGVFRMVVTVGVIFPAYLTIISRSQATKRAHDVRVTILQALADIPYWVGRANRYRDLYKDSKPRELVEMTAQLCSAVLLALRHIMIYLTEGILSMVIR